MKTKDSVKKSWAGADVAFERLRCAEPAGRADCPACPDLSLRDIAGSKISCTQIKELWSDRPRNAHTPTPAPTMAPCGVLQGGESVPCGCLTQAHELSLLSLWERQHNDAQLFAQHARSGSDRVSVSSSPLRRRSRRSRCFHLNPNPFS